MFWIKELCPYLHTIPDMINLKMFGVKNGLNADIDRWLTVVKDDEQYVCRGNLGPLRWIEYTYTIDNDNSDDYIVHRDHSIDLSDPTNPTLNTKKMTVAAYFGKTLMRSNWIIKNGEWHCDRFKDAHVERETWFYKNRELNKMSIKKSTIRTVSKLNKLVSYVKSMDIMCIRDQCHIKNNYTIHTQYCTDGIIKEIHFKSIRGWDKLKEIVFVFNIKGKLDVIRYPNNVLYNQQRLNTFQIESFKDIFPKEIIDDVHNCIALVIWRG